MAFHRLCSLFNCLSGIRTKSVAVGEDRSFPTSPCGTSGERELSQEDNCLVSRPISQVASPVAKPAAPRVAAREITRTAIIYNEQRSPSQDELSSLANSSSESSRLADTGPLLPALQTYLAQPDSSTAFTLDQQLWTHLAGNNTRFWSDRKDRQDEDDRPLYAPLDQARRETRVLKISRTDQGGDGGGDTFHADLVCVSLDDDPAYLAISYKWGDPWIVGHFESHRGGHGKRVPYNKAVFDIIKTILGRDTTVYLWIDALCINQEDLNERASQVAMMGTIYSQARQVIAFIGEADETIITAMNLVILTANCISAQGSLGDPLTASGIAGLISEIAPSDRDWESIKGLTSRPWFRRLWVVQEVALGKDPVVVCGEHVFPWVALKSLIAFTYAIHKFPVLRRVAFSTFDALLTVFECLSNAAGISNARQGQSNDRPKMHFIYSLFSLNANFDSTDPRDRIYALLSLDTAKKYRDVFRPDYEIKVEDLYVKVAREIIMKEDSIRFLHLAGISHRRSLSLPSWVPDWTSLTKSLIHHTDLSGPLQERYTEVHQPRFSFDPSSPLVLTLYGKVNEPIALITRDPHPDLSALRERSRFETAALYMDAVMRLVHATHPESVGKPPHELPWLKQLMETLSITGSPLGDYWSQWHGVVVDDLGTTRTWTVSQVGFEKFLERLRRWSCDRDVVPEMSVEESEFGDLFASAALGRRFYVSSAGHFGLAAGDARVGDCICVFEGYSVPFVVRPVDEVDISKGVYLVGEAVST